MRRLAIIAATMLLTGCGSHSSLPQPSHTTPQIYQHKLTKSGWQVIRINPVGGQPAQPIALAADASHKMWATVASAGGGELVKILMSGEQRPFPLSFSPGSLVFGPDGNMWVGGGSLKSGYLIASVDPNGVETDHPVVLPSGDMLGDLIFGPDGAIWFGVVNTDQKTGGVGRMDLSGAYTFYPGPLVYTNLVSGPDGNIWFGQYPSNTIYAMNMQGQIVKTIPVTGEYLFTGLSAGSDGRMYLTASGGEALVRIGMDGTTTYIDAPGSGSLGGLANDPSGNLWILNSHSNKTSLVTFDPKSQTYGQSAPGLDGMYGDPIFGPDGNLWMTSANPRQPTVAIYVVQKMAVSPNAFTLSVGQQGMFSTSEANYSGAWTAVATDTTVVSVTPQSQAGQFTITALKPGFTHVVVYDSMFNSIAVKVTVQ